MRIRKRPAPFLSPVAISDPLLNLNRPPPVPVVVQLGHHDVSCDAVSPQRSDRPIGQGSSADGCDSISDKEDTKEKRVRPELLIEDEDEGEKGNDVSKKNISSAQTVSGSQHKSSPKSSSSQVPIPPKKRSRGNNNNNNNNIITNTTRGSARDPNTIDNKITSKTRRSTKRSRKNDNVYGRNGDDDDNDNDDDDDDDDDPEIQASSGVNNAATKRASKAAGRGGALMEGSRCSRVNGRGWRCCQQTLVGYSLCEHHLGKGRLRSITSVRSRSFAKPITTATGTTTTDTGTTTTAPSSTGTTAFTASKAVVPGATGGELRSGVDGTVEATTRDRDDQKVVIKSGGGVGKKRAKLGMVKARSISSLLGQTTNSASSAVSMADYDQYSK